MFLQWKTDRKSHIVPVSIILNDVNDRNAPPYPIWLFWDLLYRSEWR